MNAPASSSRRHRAEHLGPERRRPQILDAALDIAAAQGIAGVTIASVAERLDVTRPVVYSCFASRADLVDALLRREERYLDARLSEAVHERTVNAGEDVFVEGFSAMLRVVVDRPQAWRLVFGHPDPVVADLAGSGRAALVARCTRLLGPTLSAWGIDDAQTKLPALVELWVSAGEGAVRTLLADDTWTPESLGGVVGAAVYRALRGA